jgi:hypothetical protein
MERRQRKFYEEFLKNTKDLPIFSLKMDTLEAAKRFNDNTIDLLFVDDGHSYEHVKAVLEAWLPKVKKGGHIIGHDYSDYSVGRGVNEVLGDVKTCETRSGYIWEKI